MITLIHFKTFVDEINKENGRLYKQAVLKKYANDSVVRKYLQIAFDPFKVYGISSKKLHKQIAITDNYISLLTSVFGLFNYLESHNTGTTREIYECQQMLDYAIERAPDCVDLLEALICKDLSIGCDSKTINKEIPGLIPTFNVQLANKYFDKPQYVEGKTFAITTKIDGGRIIALKENGQVSFFTRAGQKYEGLVDLEDEMSRLMPDNTCLDGEITLLVRGNLSSKEAYKETMKIVRTKDKEKHGIKMLVFDCMTAEEFKAQQCKFTYLVRRTDAEKLFSYDNFTYFELLPILYRGSDTSKITEILEEEVANGEEGIMINICDAPYDFKRTNNLLKVKKFDTCDLRVIGFEEGTGKYVGMLGAFVCEYKGGEVKVGSGLTDELRKEIWRNSRSYENVIIEVSYFEETKDSTGKLSLRFPTFKDFRPDKTEPNY
jgi:DNA ligase-1